MNAPRFSRRFGRRSTRLNIRHGRDVAAEAIDVMAVTDPELGVTRQLESSSDPFAASADLEVSHV